MWLFTGVLGVFGAYHVLVGVGGWWRARGDGDEESHPDESTGGAPAPLVTFVVTAYREREVLFRCMDSVLAARHPEVRLRVVLVTDEDDAGTVEAVRERYGGPGTRVERTPEGDEVLHSERVTVVLQLGDNAGQGKPKALEKALRFTSRDGFVGLLDADHVLLPDFLERALPRFRDPTVGIVQARRSPRVRPGFSWVARWDILEQNVGMIQALRARDHVGCASFYGSTALVRAELVHDIGWEDCLTEDTFFHYEMRERGYRTAYETRTGSLEDQVGSLGQYVPQRRRWAAGHMHVMFTKMGSILRAPVARLQRVEALVHLNYYNAAVFLVAYWLLRATHYWLQDPPASLALVLVATVAAAAGAAGFELASGRRASTVAYGGIGGAIVAFVVLSFAASRGQPALVPAPVPTWLEGLLFAAPIAQIAFGYLHPHVRPRDLSFKERALDVVTLVGLAPLMLVVNLYATLTGVMESISPWGSGWVKTERSAGGKSKGVTARTPAS